MSRLGKKKIAVADGVEVNLKDHEVTVKGPKGTLTFKLDKLIGIEVKNNELEVKQENGSDSVTWGLSWALLRNALEGVSKGFEKKLEVNGVGYKAQVQGKKLVLNLGYSHQIEVGAPEGIEFKVEENIIIVSGFDKQLVGEVAAKIREKRKPEPYKGKGIKYIDEHIRRKAGKKAAATE